MTPNRIARAVLFMASVLIFVFFHGCCDPIQRQRVYDPDRRGTGRRYVDAAGVSVPE